MTRYLHQPLIGHIVEYAKNYGRDHMTLCIMKFFSTKYLTASKHADNLIQRPDLGWFNPQKYISGNLISRFLLNINYH